MKFYFSLQFSAIQKTVLRHDRLWSIAGISNILSHLNEITLPAIAETNNGTVIVAGGGKFTARFSSPVDAAEAKQKCVAEIATTLPMLEFQVSKTPWEAEAFSDLADADGRNNKAIHELEEQKRRFRGYAVSFNPHLKLCGECGEYPAVKEVTRQRNKKEVTTLFCRVCHQAFTESQNLANESQAEMTTLQKVYQGYRIKVRAARKMKPAADFKDLFPEKRDGEKSEDRKRMAVWFSDLNNMNDKVPVWLKQPEDRILATFQKFRETVVDIITEALSKTFPAPTGEFLSFRLVVAGGDDLCLVMSENDILSFSQNMSKALIDAKNKLSDDHPLSDAWLLKNGDYQGLKPKPFGFGASFVVASIHTPFSQIHQVGEDLMSDAKKVTDRQGNSVGWRIMAEEHSPTDELLSPERPLFIETGDRGKNQLNQLAFNDYLDLRDRYGGKNKIEGVSKLSGSHMHQIVKLMQEEQNPWRLERKMKLLDAAESDKSFSFLLRNKSFREANGMLLPQRIATLFELMTIAGGDQ